MTKLNDQFGGGLDPLQDHSRAGQVELSTRLTRYAVRIKDVNSYTQPVIEKGSAGDVVGATMWAPDSRPIAGWSHAWPVVGGSPVQASGQSSSKVDGAVLASVENPKPKRSGKGERAQSLRIGLDAGGDFTVLGGQGRSRTFGLPDYAFLGIQAQPISFGSFGAGAYINDQTGYFSSRQLANLDARRAGWRPRGAAGPGGAAGAAGGLGGAGAFGPGGQVPPGLRAITGSDNAAPPAFIAYQPIHDAGYNPDRTFVEDGQALPAGFPSLPGGTVGIRLGGTYAHNQQPVYVHGDPRMAAVNEGPDPAAGSMVLDTNANGEYDPGRWARLQSAWRVSPQITGDINYGKGGTLAWQLARGERDGVCGYGTVVDIGSLRANATVTTPVTTPSSPAPSAGGAGAMPGPIATRAYGSDREMWGEIARAGTEAAMASSNILKAGARGAANAPEARRAAAAANEPRLTYAFSSARMGGPIEVGHAHRDRHEVGKAGESNVNVGHLSARANFYADPLRDGPLLIERPLYPKVENFPLRARVHCQWWPGQRPELSADGPHAGLPGVYGWWAEVPTMDEGGGGDPPPPTTGPPTTPPPTKPPPTDYPYPAPGLLEPPYPPQPKTPNGGPRGVTRGLVSGSIGASAGGAGSTIGIIHRNPGFARNPGPVGRLPDVAPLAPAVPPVRAEYIRQRATPAGRTDRVTGFATATGHTVILGRPQELDALSPDFRNANDHDGDAVARVVPSRPIVARLEAWGARTGGVWSRTTRPGASRFVGGTGPGGWLLLPPELDMKDVEAGSYAVTPSASYLVAYPGTYIGWGKPQLSTGALVSGYRAGTDSTGILSVQRLDAAGSTTTCFGGDASGNFMVREGGGTILTWSGAVSDGQGLYRNGTTVAGFARMGTDTGWTAMTGTTTKGGFDTATVSTEQLAQVVKGILAALMANNRPSA